MWATTIDVFILFSWLVQAVPGQDVEDVAFTTQGNGGKFSLAFSSYASQLTFPLTGHDVAEATVDAVSSLPTINDDSLFLAA